MTLGSLLYAGSPFARLAAVASILGSFAVEAAAQGRGQPRLIRDLNAVADGRRGDPASEPEKFRITESSYPDTPCVVAGVSFFLASDGEGGRKLWRYTPGPNGSVDEEINVTNGRDPRLLRASLDGKQLYFVATMDTGNHAVHLVGPTGLAAVLPFDPAPKLISVDCATVAASGVVVLAKTTPQSGPERHVLWVENGGQLKMAAETATPPYSEAAELVAVTPASGATYYAFSAKCTAAPPHRSLVVVTPGAPSPFRELGRPTGAADVAPNPALLTPVGDELLFVELAPYGTGAGDRLRRLAGSAATTSTAVLFAPAIRDLRAVESDGTWRLLFRADNAAHTVLWSYAVDAGVGMVPLEYGGLPTSITSITSADGNTFVLGTGADRITRLWIYDGRNNVLVDGMDFPFFTCASSLAAWTDGVPRLAFLALTTDVPPLPVLVSANDGNWSTEPILDIRPGTMPQMLTRVGTALWFVATHQDHATEPWHWMY